MAKILETNLCRINYSDSLEELSNATVKLLQNKIVEYKKLFNIEFDKQIIVNYFDDLEEFREFIYKIRGERVSLPKYAKGTYDDGMVNAYIEPDTQLKRLYTASHELFHILYMKYILKNDYSNRIVWYDEGMAQFISGEKDKYADIHYGIKLCKKNIGFNGKFYTFPYFCAFLLKRFMKTFKHTTKD